MLLIKATTRFLKDLKRAQKRGYNIDKLEAIVDLLQAQKPLPPGIETIISPANGTTIGVQDWGRILKRAFSSF